MIRSIMVPTDGSEFSCQAFPLAVMVARSTGGTLKIVQVHMPILPMVAMDGVAALDYQFERETEQQEQQYLATLSAKLSEESGVPVAHELIRGDVVPALVQFAKDTGIDFVVMTTHGRGGFARGFLGSVADDLIHDIRMPVLLTRPNARGAATHLSYKLDHILVPLDGSALSESVLPIALTLGASGSRYTLLRVREPSDVLGDGYYASAILRDDAAEDAAAARALSYLEHIAAPLRASGTQIETAVQFGATAAADIVDYAHAHGVNVIAMSTHGRHGVARVALGSVADRVMRDFVGSALVYRPVKASADVTEDGSHNYEKTRAWERT